MINKTGITLFFLFFTFSLFAQQINIPDYSFRLGLTAHPTFGYIKAKNGKGEGASLGFSFGVLGDFDLSKKLTFATALTITSINGKSSEVNPTHYHEASNPNTLTYKLKYKMRYLEIPLTVKLKTEQMGTVKWYGQLGLSNDFALGRKQNAELGNTVLADNVNSADWTSFYRAGIIIGGGVEYSLDEKTTILTGLTLNNGFTNISSNQGFERKSNVRNHYLGLTVGVLF